MGSESSHRIWFRSNDPYLKEFDEFKKRFGNDENILLIVHAKDGLFNKEAIKELESLTELLWQTPNIVRVDSLTNYSLVTSKNDDINIEAFIEDAASLTQSELDQKSKVIQALPDVKNFLIDKDNKTTVIYGRLRPIEKALVYYNQSLKHIDKKLEELDFKKIEVKIGGTAPLNVAFRNISMSDLNKILPLVLLSIVVILFLVFKSFKIIIFLAIELAFAIISTMGVAGWLGINFSMIISMVPIIIAAITLADTVHILSTYREEKLALNNEESLKSSLLKNFNPTFLTTISTMIGFLGLMSSDLKPIKDLGAISALGVLFSWLASLYIVIPLCKLFPVAFKYDGTSSKKINGEKFVSFLSHHKLKVLSLFLVVTVFSVFISLKNEVNSNVMKYFAKDVPVRVANEFLREKIGGYSGVQIVFKTNIDGGIKDPAFLRKVESFSSIIQSWDEISKVNSLVDILKKTNKSLHGDQQQYFAIPKSRDLVAQEILLYELSIPEGKNLSYWFNTNYETLRMDIIWKIDDSVKALETINKIKDEISKSGLNGSVTGKAAIIMGLDSYIVSTFATSILTALVLVAFLMMYLFRSVKMGLLSMIPNLLPPLYGLAFLTLIGGNIDVGVILITAICLGIAVDDTIYFLTNFNNHYKKTKCKNESLIISLNSIGTSLINTTIILVLSFMCFIFSDFEPNRNFGIITAFVLTMALITDLVLLPALLVNRSRD
ncbi:hypothetical protein A9Q84_12180 [Halobacteriovorax marinus]|uniref:SSD domain-containing protein n=1 Tax=Halobacteriovorax marinus TaxID=97084 RepID=A0A1Y5FES5_9BACT|nr:hypothetical protein A9Q84_12180 [Halobacteriovorax marinus]